MSINVLVIPEDFRKDQFLLKPIVERLFRSIKVKARVEICFDPLLAGVKDLPSDWSWSAVRAHCDPKEAYFDPYIASRNLTFAAGEGRDIVGREAAANYKRIRNLCKEDVLNLEQRIRAMLETGVCP